MGLLMPLLMSLTWMRIYHRKALLSHCPMIMIVSGYILFRYSSMANPELMKWVPTSFFLESQSLFAKVKCTCPQLFGCHLRGECCFLNLYSDCVHWCVTCCSWVWVQLDDNFRPDVHRAEGCDLPPLCQCGVLKQIITTKWEVSFQLVPPNMHWRNAAARVIRAFKAHFLAILVGVADDYPQILWDLLLTQAVLTLNLLRQARLNPSVSSWKFLEWPLYYNANPLGPLGCPVMIHNKTATRNLWDFWSK